MTEILPQKYDRLYLTVTYLIITFFTLGWVWQYIWNLDPRLIITYLLAVLVGTLGTNVGYHRLFKHKAFKTSKFWYNTLAFFAGNDLPNKVV